MKTHVDLREKHGIDSITAEVLRNAFVNVVKNMENALMRTAFSTVVRDFRDSSCSLIGPEECDLEMVASAEGAPLQIGVVQFQARENLKEYGIENLEPGDELIFNDPYRGGNHANDTATLRPVFFHGRLIAFVASRTHLVDVGGTILGSWPVGGDVRTIMEETSMRLPPMLLYKKNVPVKSVFSFLMDATRTPIMNLGDLQAQHSANLTGEREILRFCDKYGPDTVIAAMKYTLDHGELLMRDAIGKIPDGRYEAEDYLDDDGVETDRLLKLKCTITIKGENAEIDFSGTERQTEGNISSTWGVSAAVTLITFKMMVGPFTPSNGGIMRPIDILLPAGSMVHTLPYHACCDGNVAVSTRIISVILKCFRQLQELAAGDIYNNIGIAIAAGEHDPRSEKVDMPWVSFLTAFSGWGATAQRDGHLYATLPLGNCVDIPVEALEIEYPFIVTRKTFTTDSGGPGRNRGGLGGCFEYYFLAEAISSSSIDRIKTNCFGVQGGKGSHNSLTYTLQADSPSEIIKFPNKINVKDGWKPWLGLYDRKTHRPTLDISNGQFISGKFSGKIVEKNSALRIYMPGGGGYGNPLDREPARVKQDVINEFVSIEGARKDYGVVIDGNTFEIEVEETRKVREALSVDKDFLMKEYPLGWFEE